jgi:hypothetical protein
MPRTHRVGKDTEGRTNAADRSAATWRADALQPALGGLSERKGLQEEEVGMNTAARSGFVCDRCGEVVGTKTTPSNIRVDEGRCLRLCNECAAAHDATSGNFYDQLLKTADALQKVGMQARHLLADWPGQNDEQRRTDFPEFSSLEFLATDALNQAERLRALHEKEQV